MSYIYIYIYIYDSKWNLKRKDNMNWFKDYIGKYFIDVDAKKYSDRIFRFS